MPRFKTVEDIFEAFRRAGYRRMKSLDPDADPVFRKTVKLPETSVTDHVHVRIETGYRPLVHFTFPTISKGDTHSTKRAWIPYLRTKEGLFPISVEYDIRGGKNLSPSAESLESIY
jgi:hypothetical protein